MYNSLYELMEKLGGTEGQNKVLEYIVNKKDTKGYDTPGKLQITYRQLAENAGVSLGTVTRSFVHWENACVIQVRSGMNRREPNTILYLGPPPTVEDHPLFIIKEEHNEIVLKTKELFGQIDNLNKKIDFLIRRERDNPVSILRTGRPRQVGEVEGKPMFVLDAENDEIKELFDENK